MPARFVGCIVVLLLCASCAAQRYGNALEALQGKPVARIVRALGAPQAATDNAYIWRKHAVVHTPAHWGTVYETVNHYNRKGRFIGSSQVPVQRYYEPRNDVYWCTTTVYVNEHSIVTGFIFEGNACTEYEALQSVAD